MARTPEMAREFKLQELAERVVRTNVHYCVTGMVSRLVELDENLQSDVLDACSEHGTVHYSCSECGHASEMDAADWNDLADCEKCGAECSLSEHDRTDAEVYEWWAVDSWFARKLEESGAIILHDCYGAVVWGRETTGQSICLDDLVQQIAAEMWPEELTPEPEPQAPAAAPEPTDCCSAAHPGIVVNAETGRVERCDDCERFADDDAAEEALRKLGFDVDADGCVVEHSRRCGCIG